MEIKRAQSGVPDIQDIAVQSINDKGISAAIRAHETIALVLAVVAVLARRRLTHT